MSFKRRNIPMTDDLKKEISGAKNIFEVFYSMSRETPPGAYPLNTGEWIRGCQPLYPEFYQKAVEYGSKNYIRTGTNAQYEAELASTGQSGMFVIEGSDIRLPKVTRYIRGYESNQAVNVHNKVYTSGLPDINLALRYDDWNPGPVLSAYGANGHAVYGTRENDEYMINISGVAIRNRAGDLIKDPAYTRYKNNAHGFAKEVVAPCVAMSLYIQVFNQAPMAGYVNVQNVLKLITDYTKQMNKKYEEAIDAVNAVLQGGVLGAPNYAKGVVISSNASSYTAPSDGWIYNRWVRSGVGATLILTTYIYSDATKSKRLFTYTNSDGRRPDKDSGKTDLTNFIPVRKGNYIEWTRYSQRNGAMTNYFYPSFGQ